MEFIRFIFEDLFHFIGFVIIVVFILEGIEDIVKAWRNKK